MTLQIYKITLFKLSLVNNIYVVMEWETEGVIYKQRFRYPCRGGGGGGGLLLVREHFLKGLIEITLA